MCRGLLLMLLFPFILPLGVHAEHAEIKLRIMRLEGSSMKSREEASAVADEEPPEGGIVPRPVFKAKVDDPLVMQFMLTNAYPHGELKMVMVRYFVIRTEKTGQKKVPNLERGAITQGSFLMNLKPKGRVGARVAFTISTPGSYLLRVQTANTKSDHEHFSAIDLQIDD